MTEWRYKRGLPDKAQCFSKSIKPFLEYLHQRRQRCAPLPNRAESRSVADAPIPVTRASREIKDNDLGYIGIRLEEATERVHTSVFGPKLTDKKVLDYNQVALPDIAANPVRDTSPTITAAR